MAVILTNKLNLPDVFYRACLIDRHITKGDISCTQLIDAPQIRMLRIKHDLEEDVSDRLQMLFGTAMHHVLERAEVDSFSARQLLDAAVVLDDLGKPTGADSLRALAREKFPKAFDGNNMIETTLSYVIDTPVGSLELSGTMDKYEKMAKRLTDYKNTSVWGYVYEESKKKWYAQQNVYAFMLREHGFEVEEAVITAFFKDYKAMDAVRNKDYPPALAMDIPIPLLDNNVVRDFLKKRAVLHIKAMNGEDVPCTPKEMWSKSPKFAVTTKSRKRAIKVFPKKGLAEKFMDDNELKYPGMYIDYRPGENSRCEKFCPVRSVCPQKKANDLKNKKTETNE